MSMIRLLRRAALLAPFLALATSAVVADRKSVV